VWTSSHAHAIGIHVRRLKCSACGATFTVLPSFLHPFRRYPLATIQEIVVQRHGEKRTYREIEDALPSPAASTQREWADAWEVSAPGWLSILTAWFSTVDPTITLDRHVSGGEAAGLVATALHCLDWLANFLLLRHSVSDRLLETLWLWGAARVGQLLLHPTRCRAGPKRCGLPIS